MSSSLDELDHELLGDAPTVELNTVAAAHTEQGDTQMINTAHPMNAAMPDSIGGIEARYEKFFKETAATSRTKDTIVSPVIKTETESIDALIKKRTIADNSTDDENDSYPKKRTQVKIYGAVGAQPLADTDDEDFLNTIADCPTPAKGTAKLTFIAPPPRPKQKTGRLVKKNGFLINLTDDEADEEDKADEEADDEGADVSDLESMNTTDSEVDRGANILLNLARGIVSDDDTISEPSTPSPEKHSAVEHPPSSSQNPFISSNSLDETVEQPALTAGDKPIAKPTGETKTTAPAKKALPKVKPEPSTVINTPSKAKKTSTPALVRATRTPHHRGLRSKTRAILNTSEATPMLPNPIPSTSPSQPAQLTTTQPLTSSPSAETTTAPQATLTATTPKKICKTTGLPFDHHLTVRATPRKRGVPKAECVAGQIAIPATWATATDADKTLISMKNEGKDWETIRKAWKEATGQETAPSTLPNRYNRLIGNFVVLEDGEAQVLLQSVAEVEAKFEAEKWARVAAAMEHRGVQRYPAEFVKKMYAKIVAAGTEAEEGGEGGEEV